MGQSLGEFFVTLGVDSSSGVVTVKDLISAFGELEASTLGEIGALSTFGVALAELADHGMTVAESFRSFTNQTGLSLHELEKWQIASNQVGVDAATVASSIKTLQKNLADISIGRGNISPYQLLGITPTGDAFKVLDQLRDRIKRVNPAMATNLVQQMGLDPQMLNILKLSNDEFEKLSKVARGMTDQQAIGFLQMKQDLSQINSQMSEMGYSAGLWLKPLIDDAAYLVNLLHEYPKTFLAIGAALAVVGAAVSIAFFPWLATALAISAALGGIILVLDDIISYFRTGKSAGAEFGNVLEKLFKGGEHSVANWMWEKGLLGNQGPVLGAPATAGAGGGQTNHINIVVHDSSGRPHEVVADEYKRSIDHADKMRP